MSYQNNIYYSIAKFGSEVLHASETLLKSYPLTKACLEILGKDLTKSLAFGFFLPSFEVIKQGEKGKDLFLFCNHLADVFVFKKLIVQMDAPALFGDKAIIDRNSTRNATISVADGEHALIIKIPLGKFLRDFKDASVEDKSFIRETRIFYSLFLEIQNRLFKYVEIQKQLWDEVNKQLKLLNIQLLANSLNKQESKNWDPKTWQVIHQYLRSAHKFSWPNNVEYNTKSLVEILKSILDKKFPKKGYKGTDQSYAYHKQLIWRRWLETLCELLTKVLSNEQLPINIGEVQLFNPKIYQMRMHTLLVSIQRNFMFKKVPPREEIFDSEKLKAKKFFSSKTAENEFNLDAYLKTLREMFILKNPNRVLAQVAQQTAQLSATCENEFNTSVSQMQYFLEKVRKLAIVQEEEGGEEGKIKIRLQENIAVINKGFTAYNARIVGHTYTFAGVIKFAEAKVPIVSDLIKTCGTDQLKKNVGLAFANILKLLDLKLPGVETKKLNEMFFLCQGTSKDIIPTSQIMTHYWIPVSDGITLKKGEKEFGPLKPGTLIGGDAWDFKSGGFEEDSKESEEWTIHMPKKDADQPIDQLFLILVIPKRRIPWKINSDPIQDEIEISHLPLLQFMVSKNLESLALLSEVRDSLLKKYSQVIEVVVTEKKVREFENNKNRIPEAKYHQILKLVYETLGVTLERQESISSEKFSKQLYNEILKQTKDNYPNINIEEQGNKAYTLWRYIQSEIISRVYADEFDEKVKIEPPESVYLQIKRDIDSLFEKAMVDFPADLYDLSEEGGSIQLNAFIKSENTLLPNELLKMMLGIKDITEQHYHMLIDETNTYKDRLKQISSLQTEFDVNEIQSALIIEAIDKLQTALQEKFAD